MGILNFLDGVAMPRNLVAAGLPLITTSVDAGGFRFDGSKAVDDPRRFVEIGEKMSPATLNKRMAGAKVEMSHEECAGTCATVTTGARSPIYLAWGMPGNGGVYLVSSAAKGSRDATGVAIGASLKAAAGSGSVCEC